MQVNKGSKSPVSGDFFSVVVTMDETKGTTTLFTNPLIPIELIKELYNRVNKYFYGKTTTQSVCEEVAKFMIDNVNEWLRIKQLVLKNNIFLGINVPICQDSFLTEVPSVDSNQKLL